MKHTHSICLIAAVVMTAGAHGGAVEDRTAVERVYHGHRSGETRRFDEVATSADIQHLVTRDAWKERVLLEHYRVSVTDALVDEEVTRINHSTRAPDVLAEIRAALGNDEKRFADAVARPIVIDRLLTAHFASDAAVHGPLAEKVKAQREALLAASAEERIARSKQHSADTAQVTFDLTADAAVQAESAPLVSSTPQPVKGTAASTNYSVEATTQVAQMLSSGGEQPAAKSATRHPITDLHPEIQAVLKQSLHQPGDVTPVIETATHILLYLAISRDEKTLETQVLAQAKLSLDAWLEQPTTLHAASRP